ACTGIDNIAEAITLLELNNWDLVAAINGVIPQENGILQSSSFTSEASQTGPPTAPAAAPPPPPAAVSASTSPSSSSSSSSSAFCPVPPARHIVERQPRMLNFHVEYRTRAIEVVLEEASTVGDIKQILETELQVPVSKMQLKGWKSGDVSDSTVLRSLHLPKNTSLYVLTPDIAPCAGTSLSSLQQESLNQNYLLVITHREAQREYSLNFPGSRTVQEVKRNISDLTNIPVRHQQWEGWPASASDDSMTLASCGITYPCHRLSVCRRSSPASALEPTEECTDVHMVSDSEGDDFEDASEFGVDECEIFGMGSSSCRKSPMMPENSENEGDALLHFTAEFSSRYGDCHPVFYIGSLEAASQEAFYGKARDFVRERRHHSCPVRREGKAGSHVARYSARSVGRWGAWVASRLILALGPANAGGFTVAAVKEAWEEDAVIRRLCERRFSSAHRADRLSSSFPSLVPSFITSFRLLASLCAEQVGRSWDLGESFRRKLLAIYLHNDDSVLSNVFCSQMMCADSIVSYLSQNFITWAWDVTKEANKARLLTMCTRHFGSVVAQTIRTYKTDQFPLLLIVMGKRTSNEVLNVIQGNTTVDELMMRLMGAMEIFTAQQQEDIRDEDEREAREMVKREQDEAYRLSLEADRKKLQCRKLYFTFVREKHRNGKRRSKYVRSKSGKSKKRNERRVRTQSGPGFKGLVEKSSFLLFLVTCPYSVYLAIRLSLEQALPPEPSEDGGERISKLRIRTPSGEFLERRFLGTTRLQVLFDFVASKGYPSDEFKLLTTFPRRNPPRLTAFALFPRGCFVYAGRVRRLRVATIPFRCVSAFFLQPRRLAQVPASVFGLAPRLQRVELLSQASQEAMDRRPSPPMTPPRPPPASSRDPTAPNPPTGR
ncbi:hypothetical protein P4O66_022890, partial [Electrophorus voltai]